MEKLAQKYQIELNTIKGAIQSSDVLQTYLETEEDDDYTALRNAFEPQIDHLYQTVAEENPLQLIQLEKALLDPDFEGLYLSRVLGYTVLRGEIDENYTYKRPQDHFGEVLTAICLSSNFDLISMRIGQGIQLGFALSSDIWITHLIEQIPNKRARQYLDSQKLLKYRDLKHRKNGYLKYARQFEHANFQSAEFPKTKSELKVLFSALKSFLLYRIRHQKHNVSLLPNIRAFLENPDFKNTPEYVEMLCLFANYNSQAENVDWFKDLFNTSRKEHDNFAVEYFDCVEFLFGEDLPLGKTQDMRVIDILDAQINDDLKKYYDLMKIIHTKGYVHDDAIEAVRVFYDSHEGLSTINECLRLSIFRHFQALMDNLDVETYTDYFELQKIFAIYLQLFNNQQFNIDLKELHLKYIRKLLKRYKDKRGKDYQDIKKFVTHTFLEFGFMTEKQLVELFKTRRKKKTATP